VADVGDYMVSREVKGKLFAAIGLGVLGGVAWTAGAGLIGTLVAICLFLAAGYLVLSVLRHGIILFEQQFSEFSR